MSKINGETTAKGLVLPITILKEWGFEEGMKVVIEFHDNTISIKPAEVTAQEIASRASTFLLKKVGDAMVVQTPVRDGDKWRVTVVLPHRKKDLGQLTYTLDGFLVPEESNTPEELTQKANED